VSRHLRRPRGQVLTVAVSLFAFLLAGLMQPMGAVAADGPDVWTPSNWTGEAAGPPVPGVGLPPASLPTIAAALPQGVYDVSPTYEGQAQCDPAAKPGTQALADLIKATYGQDQTVWIPRACSIGGQSEHKEGRALDWMTSARVAQQRANAETFLAWLLGPDQYGVPYGNAMRLGVMYIGWNDRIWRGYDIKRGWTELKGCFATPASGSDTTCHRNHIHISFTWDGASGRSSFWDGTPMDGPYCDRQHSSATTPAGGRAADAVPVGPVRVLGTRKAVGVPIRCRLQQDRWSGDSHRLYVKVTGQGGIPETGVAAVAVQVVAMGSNAASSVRIWSPGQSKSEVVANVPMNMDASGTAIVPVASDGTIVLATSAGATDLAVDVTGFYGPGDVPNDTVTTPGPATAMGDEPPPAIPPAPAPNPAPNPAPTFAPDPPPADKPAAPTDEFVSIGSEVSYDTLGGSALRAGETRAVALAGVPAEATSALVLLTTRAASKRGTLVIGRVGEKSAAATFAFPKKAIRAAVLVIPLSGGRVQFVAPKKSALHVRVEVLGYTTSGRPIDVRGLPSFTIARAKLAAGENLVLGPVIGVGGLPKKNKKVAGVILRIRTRTPGKVPGSLKAYGLNTPMPGTSSAPILARKWYTTLLVTEVGTDGKIVLTPSVKGRVQAAIVGYIHR
jgi:hypothetical protein